MSAGEGDALLGQIPLPVTPIRIQKMAANWGFRMMEVERQH